MREVTASRYRTQYPYARSISGYGLGWSGVCKLKKAKILGVACYGISMPNTIQPGEYSMGGGTDGTLYATATRTTTCMCVTSIGTTAGGTGATTGSTTTGMIRTLRLCALFNSLLSRIKRESFVFESGESIRRPSCLSFRDVQI